jgi:hypothetical protein
MSGLGLRSPVYINRPDLHFACCFGCAMLETRVAIQLTKRWRESAFNPEVNELVDALEESVPKKP